MTSNSFWRIAVSNIEAKFRASAPDQDTEQIPIARNEDLVRHLLACIDDHRAETDKRVLNAIVNLARYSEAKQIALKGSARKSRTHGRKPFLTVVAEYIDPALQEAIQPVSLAFRALGERGLLPLGNRLTSPAQYPRVISDLDHVVEELEQALDQPTYDYDDIQRAAESISLIAAVLSVIHKSIVSEEPRWCQTCFRRAEPDSNYCGAHLPMDKGSDSQYRKSLRLKPLLSEKVKKYWAAYRMERRLFGSPINYVSDILTSKPVATSSLAGLQIAPEILAIVKATTQMSWQQVSESWELLISEAFPQTFSAMDTRPKQCQDWNECANEIRFAHQDFMEDSSEPYWILCMMICAEDWLELEAKLGDGRLTETKSRIFSLFDSGVSSHAEIARLVGKSRQYVSKVINSLR